MHRTRAAVAGVLSLAMGFVSAAALADGVDAGSFVRDGIGARALGMGSAAVAVADGPTAAFWNPASLSSVEGLAASSMYANKFGLDIGYQSLGLAAAVTENLGAGLLMIRSSIDDIPFTGDEGDGVFSETQTLYVLAVGYEVSGLLLPQEQTRTSVAFGTGLKAYTHSLLEGRGSGVGLDVGVDVGFSVGWGRLKMSLSAVDIGETAIRWEGTDHNPTNYVPWTNRFGAALGLLGDSLWLSGQADVAVGRPHLNRMRIGVECWPIAQVSGRAGATFASDGTTRFTAGGSISWHGLRIDYAFLPNAVLGDTHVFSLGMGFKLPARDGGDT
ncbi:hypothetical protein ACFLTM_04940 [Candidatus Bipolaricaulota bacterium]